MNSNHDVYLCAKKLYMIYGDNCMLDGYVFSDNLLFREYIIFEYMNDSTNPHIKNKTKVIFTENFYDEMRKEIE